MVEYILSLAVITLVWTLSVQAYNISFGLTGMFNLGHVVFYGVGAYTAAILNTQHEFGFFANLIFAACMAGIFAAAFGLLTLRLSGHYLAIATLGGAMIANVVATNWVSLTRGPLGIRGIDEPVIWGYQITKGWEFFLLYLAITILVSMTLYRLFCSPYGRLLRAIKDDEISAKALGKNTFSAKMWALVLSGSFAGIAGAMYAHYRVFLDPTIFQLPEIIYLILALVVGGLGNFWGAILGTILIVAIGEIPRFFGFPDHMVGAMRNLFYAALLISVMFYRPKGLFTRFQQKS